MSARNRVTLTSLHSPVVAYNPVFSDSPSAAVSMSGADHTNTGFALETLFHKTSARKLLNGKYLALDFLAMPMARYRPQPAHTAYTAMLNEFGRTLWSPVTEIMIHGIAVLLNFGTA